MLPNPVDYLANPRTVAPCEFAVRWDDYSNVILVRGPAYRLIRLAVGEEGRYGTIYEYTPDWARIGYELVSPCVTMERARQDGHEIEGYVRIRGKRYSAFTAGGSGNEPGMIVVRSRQ